MFAAKGRNLKPGLVTITLIERSPSVKVEVSVSQGHLCTSDLLNTHC